MRQPIYTHERAGTDREETATSSVLRRRRRREGVSELQGRRTDRTDVDRRLERRRRAADAAVLQNVKGEVEGCAGRFAVRGGNEREGADALHGAERVSRVRAQKRGERNGEIGLPLLGVDAAGYERGDVDVVIKQAESGNMRDAQWTKCVQVTRNTKVLKVSEAEKSF